MKNDISVSGNSSGFDVSTDISSASLENSTEADQNTIDLEKVEAVIADQCNSVFEGKLGEQNICMSIYRKGSVLTASYILQNDQDREMNLQGTIQPDAASFVLNSKDGAAFTGKIEPETKEGSLLKGDYTYSAKGKNSKFSLALSHTIGDTYESRYRLTSSNTKDIEAFASKIKLYVTENNKTGLAEMIAYPIKVTINDSKVSISNKQEFVQKYDDIVNAEFKEKISNCYTKYLFSNDEGIMLGDGEIWFDNLNNNGLRIYAINN